MSEPEVTVAQQTILRALEAIERCGAEVRHIAVVWSTSAEDTEGNVVADDGCVFSPDPDWLIAAMLANAAEMVDCGISTLDDE